jgi:Predicted transcriptional regulator with C-terminal CBS domains
MKKYTILDYYLHFRVIISIFEPKVYFIGLMNLQEVMKSRRKTLSLSQQDLAEMAGIGLSTVKDIERGQGNPSLATISKILEVLGMEMIFQVRQMV